MTGPRRRIIDVLESASEYLSADEVYHEVYQTHPAVGIATVYRTLQLLSESGLAEKVDTGDGKARYRLAATPGTSRAVVVVCSNCGRTVPASQLTDEDRSHLLALERSVGNRNGFEVRRSVLQIVGSCDECGNG
jgi:Fur family ferric uptake transcriptional regulator